MQNKGWRTMTKYQVWLLGSDGKNYVITYESLQQKLGICKLEDEILDLARRLTIAERPLRKKKILELLKQEGPRSMVFIRNRIMYFQTTDLHELVNENKVFKEKHGNRALYGISQGE